MNHKLEVCLMIHLNIYHIRSFIIHFDFHIQKLTDCLGDIVWDFEEFA
jgi:hypothetical protein